MGDGIFTAAGQITAAAIQAGAIKEATQMQLDALQKQRDFVFSNLDPNVVQGNATAADVQNSYARLALQGQIDPALLQARYQSENNLLSQGAKIGEQSGKVGDQATAEALAGTPGMQDAKNQLVDQALTQLKAGATLPPDVEAQLVQAGLEQSGMTVGHASGQGVGGQQLRTILGTAGIQLQQQRQEQASKLLASAQNLENSRQNILQNLFPSLANTQLANLKGTTGVLDTSAGMLPNAGLNGSNIANIMLARVGATNQLAQSSADAIGRGGMAQGAVWGNAIGGATGALGKAGAGSAIGNTVSGWFGGSGGGPSMDSSGMGLG